jgi:hypothetical protein
MALQKKNRETTVFYTEEKYREKVTRCCAEMGVKSTEYAEWQRPLSGVQSIIMAKSAQAGEGGGHTSTPFHYIHQHVQSCGVQCTLQLRARYTPPISTLGPYALCGKICLKASGMYTVALYTYPLHYTVYLTREKPTARGLAVIGVLPSLDWERVKGMTTTVMEGANETKSTSSSLVSIF